MEGSPLPRLLFGYGVDWWNGAVVIALAIAAVAAIVVRLVTTGSVIVNRRVAAADSDALARYKLTTAQQVALANEAGVNAGLSAASAHDLANGARAEIEKAKAAAAEANARAADANARAAEANLAFQLYKSPRSLSHLQKERIVSKIYLDSGQEYFLSVAAGDEANSFLAEINHILIDAGWKRSDRKSAGVQISTSLGYVEANMTSYVRIRISMN